MGAPPLTSTQGALTTRKHTRKTFEDTPIFDVIEEPETLRLIAGNDIYLLGGQFAILCQFAHPSLAKGSYKHSNFPSRIYQRLRNTSRFINVAIFGTAEEKKAIFSVIHRYHSCVKGTDYDADDPELHKWTAATLFVSMLMVHETFIGKLPQDMVEALYKESAIFGTSLRMPPKMWPATLDDFWAYWNNNLATLEITEEAYNLSQHLLYPTSLPLWMVFMSPFARLITTNWLPERLATGYRLQPPTVSRILYRYVVLSVRIMYPIIPNGLKQRQHRIHMEDLKKAVNRIMETGHWAVP